MKIVSLFAIARSGYRKCSDVRRHTTRAWVMGTLLAITSSVMGQADPSPPPTSRTTRPPANRTAPPQNNPPENTKREDDLDTSRGFRGAGVQSLDDLRSLVIEGPQGSVDALSKVIEELDRLSIGSDAAIEVVRLASADSEALAEALTQVFDSRETARPQTRQNRGKTAFVAIAQPNAIVVVAPAAEIAEVVDFVHRLDTNTRGSSQQFKVFRLKSATASSVRDKLIQFFTAREDDALLRVRVEVVADDRTNSLLVYGGPKDLEQTAILIEQLDAAETDAVNELRIFPLRFAQATTLAAIINDAINQQTLISATQQTGGNAQQRQGNQPQGGASTPGQSGSVKATKLRLTSTDETGKIVESGILENLKVTADTRTNALVVSAPPASMSLVEALISQLDQGLGPSQTVRVFTLQNSNAEDMLQTLQRIFLGTSSGTTGTTGGTTQAGGAGGQQGFQQQQTSQTGVGTTGVGGTSATNANVYVLPVRFTPDFRSNSIIASGSDQDLERIAALVRQLDASENKMRQTVIYRLKNLSANDAVTALTTYLQQERLNSQITVISVVADRTQQDDSQSVVSSSASTSNASTTERTPLEPQGNSIIITATPGLLENFIHVIEQIDQQPPQVVIQVVIAQIDLTNNEELGVELGVQNNILYDRSLAVSNVSGSGYTQAQNSLNPGYNFNSSAPLQSPVGSNPNPLGLQGLSNFALNRAGSLGYGGLIFAASNDNISILLRALKVQRRIDVLSRPQIMTLDNQQASIQIGQRIRVPTGSVTGTQGGTTNSYQAEDIGIILAVTPRISPDGHILMRVAPQISDLQRDSNGAISGLPVGVNQEGTVITTPIINITQAITTVAANDGETVVIGGLIKKTTTIEEREIPWLGDIPYLEWLFKTQFRSVGKSELMIILTPHVVYDDADADRIKQLEACRVDWITSDVKEVHGDIGVYCPNKDGDCDNTDSKHHDKYKKTGPVLNLPIPRKVLPRSIPHHVRAQRTPSYDSINTTGPLSGGADEGEGEVEMAPVEEQQVPVDNTPVTPIDPQAPSMRRTPPTPPEPTNPGIPPSEILVPNDVKGPGNSDSSPLPSPSASIQSVGAGNPVTAKQRPRRSLMQVLGQKSKEGAVR